MSNNLKGQLTSGQWRHVATPWDKRDDLYQVQWSDIGECVAEIVHGEANAALMAEAGNVANETGLWPRELADQREELLAVVEEILHSCDMWGQWDVPDGIVDRAKSAVAKAKGGTE